MKSTDPKLVISSQMMDKVRYFLHTFKSLEWSGPAWYSHTKDEHGFPSIIKLEYFHPLDLGTASHTEWDGEDLMKIFKKLRKEFPEIGKSWVQGNIHSHHSMGAFFSGTDEQQCIDGANDKFYYSLVVSTKVGKELHFGTSYPDQFGQIHILEIDDIEVENDSVINPVWKKQAKLIKKNQTKVPNTYYNKYNNQLMGQATLWGGNEVTDNPQPKYNQHHYQEMFKEDETDALLEEYDIVMLEYERGRLKKSELKQALTKLGVDEYGQKIPA